MVSKNLSRNSQTSIIFLTNATIRIYLPQSNSVHHLDTHRFFCIWDGYSQYIDSCHPGSCFADDSIALLLTTAVLLFFARTVYTRRMILVFIAIALIGFLVELVGVQTGWIFGHYRYTSNFGVCWWGTPPLIGINWLFLSYAWAAVLQNTASAPVHRIVYAALGMLAYDLLLEQAAPRMQLWYWEKGNIPFSNYIAWFVLALFFQWLIRRNRIVTQNNMALPLLLLQIVLYISVILYI